MCRLINMKAEMPNFLKFYQSALIYFLLFMIGKALTILAKEEFWFNDLKTAGGLIDFKVDINAQLCKLFKLTNPESAYVTKTIRDFDASRHRKSPSNP